MTFSTSTRDTLHCPMSQRALLEPYLPTQSANSTYPFTTLTFATSLDSQLSLAPGFRTALSGPESKAMTHFLRSRHDAILIGVNTAVVDNPSLNCRLDGVGGYGGEGLQGQPRPIVIDPSMRWNFEDEGCKVMKLASEGKGNAPYVFTGCNIGVKFEAKKKFLESRGGKLITVDHKWDEYGEANMPWKDILEALKNEGLRSVMIEGGAGVINTMLSDSGAHELVRSVIVTIAPTWLGKGGVDVSPEPKTNEAGDKIPAARLKDVRWVPLREDVVLCGRLRKA